VDLNSLGIQSQDVPEGEEGGTKELDYEAFKVLLS
jgi:hypothetical protein